MRLLDFFRRGRVARDVRLVAAQGAAEAGAVEQIAILIHLTRDDDDEVADAARTTLARIPPSAIASLRTAPNLPDEVRTHVALISDEGTPVGEPAADTADDPEVVSEDRVDRQSLFQKLAAMGFSQRLKAAAKGSREARSILIRDPSKMIAMAVLNSPKLTEPEVESFARMGNVAEDVLRAIGANRAWMKNYGIVLALTKNSKTPLALSMRLMHRLNDRDLSGLSTDRNVPEPLRVAARKKVVSAVSR
jgi:hypothetical protein